MKDIEKILVKKCINGDVDAFEKLISNHQKKIFNLCYRYFNNQEDSFDISQEILIKIFRHISTFKGDSSISTWIYKIAQTTCIDELRKRKNDNCVSMDKFKEDTNFEIVDDSANPYEKFEKNELNHQVQLAIHNLAEEYKSVIILRDMQGFSYNEIAEILDLPLGTIKSRIKRGRDNIKQYLLENGNFLKEVSSK